MKRMIAAMLLAAVLLGTVGCGGDKNGSEFKLSGTYKIVSYSEGGQVYSVQSRGLTDVSIHFNEDGTGVLNGSKGSTAFTYTEDTITASGKNGDFKLSQKDGKIYVIQNVNGIDHTMVFQ